MGSGWVVETELKEVERIGYASECVGEDTCDMALSLRMASAKCQMRLFRCDLSVMASLISVMASSSKPLETLGGGLSLGLQDCGLVA